MLINHRYSLSFIRRILVACSLWFSACSIYAQEYNIISNWENITPDWQVTTPASEVVFNPEIDPVNPSIHCFKFITDEGMYEYMLTQLAQPVNFDINPRYKIKVLAPETGGDITLKFENYNNTFSQEIVLTPTPGQWTDLVYDFSGLVYNDMYKLVIFPDFEGTMPGNAWYIDDVLQETGEAPPPLELESNLPIIVINTYGEPIPDEPKITAYMGVIDNGPGMMNSLEDPFNGYDGYIGIEIRGQSSQMFPKKSYAVETRDEAGENLNVSLLGLPEENDWVFYAPYSDKSMLRNYVTFALGEKTGNYCSRQVFFELVINDEYKGVYTLMEKIKKDGDRVDIATLNPDEISGDDLTGGYIIKVDKVDDVNMATQAWISSPTPSYPNAKDIIFQYYYPDWDEIVPQQKTYIQDWIELAQSKLIIYYFANPILGYQNYFDIPSFIDFMLVCEIPKEVDNYRFSTFFYKEKDSDGGKLFAGPLWDFDLGYGNVDYWSPGLDHTGWMYETVEPNEWSIIFWWKRMMEDDYFRDMAYTRWKYLRQEKIPDAVIHHAIDSLINYIDEAKDRNFERWPILGTYVWPNYDWMGNDYEDEVEYVENFLFPRLQWMDDNIQGNLVEPKAGIAAQGNKLNIILYGDYFRRPFLEKDFFSLNNAPGLLNVQEVIYQDFNSCQLVLSADPSAYPDLTVTIAEEALNYWLDITSSPLSAQGINDPRDKMPEISLYANREQLYIRCDKPSSLPEHARVFNLTGQAIMNVELEKSNVTVVSHSLSPGFYFLLVHAGTTSHALKFTVN